MNFDKRLIELERKRDENLERVKLEIFEKVDESINLRLQHSTPSRETAERLLKLEEANKLQNEKLSLMACQVDEMYRIFTSANFMKKTIIQFFGAIGIVTGAIIGIIELLRRTKP